MGFGRAAPSPILLGMKKAIGVTLAILAVWAVILALGRGRQRGTDYGPADGRTAEQPGDRTFKQSALREIESTIAGWPQAPQLAARRMMEKYGVPDQATGRKLVWNDNGPWKRTVIKRDSGADVLEQAVDYRVPNDRYDLLRQLPNVTAERGRDELVVKSGSEGLNFLAANLADEVISGKRAVDDARRFYAKTAALAASGKTSSYTEGLLFAEQAGRKK